MGRMPAHTQSAVGLVVAILAVVALASGRPEPSDLGLTRPAPVRSAAARALRDGEPLDLNQAAAGDLMLLPRVGPKLAARILATRARLGGFRSTEDLLSVRGIGPATYERLSKLVVVRGARLPRTHSSNNTAPETVNVK